jgi:PAS domain S-box-containing protein
VRLLSTFLLLIAINTLIGAMVMEKAGNSLWYIMLATFAILVTGYGLSRSQYYGLATAVAVTIPAVPIVALILFSANPADIPNQLPWLALPLLISSLLLSLRQTTIIAISYITIITILMPFADVPRANLSESLSLILMIVFFVIAITATRQQDQSEIEHELTERKRAEEALQISQDKYRAIFEQASDSILLIDTETEALVDFNDRAHQNLGYSREELSRIKVTDIDVVESHEETLQHLAKTCGGGTEVFETKQRTKGGDIRDILVSIKMLNISGKIFSLAVWHDITEQKRAEEKLKQALANLESSNTQLAAINRELEAFSYSVSHDLRAPLRTIDGFSQALLEDYLDKLDEQGQDYLKRVRTASQRMGALIDDLLKLSRLSRSEMHQEPVDLSMLAEEIAVELQQTQPERHAEFIIGQGLMANGDRQLLRIALGNLLSNAWKFTGKLPQARIEFGITHNGSKQAYYVRDNGDGFDMKYADKLFAPFQRLHDAAEFPGNGIGLVTVQRIIHRHGGSIRAEGAVGQGATFYFTLS